MNITVPMLAKKVWDLLECSCSVKAVTTKPVYMKPSPNVLLKLLACEEAGADGMGLINTLAGMRIDAKKKTHT